MNLLQFFSKEDILSPLTFIVRTQNLGKTHFLNYLILCSKEQESHTDFQCHEVMIVMISADSVCHWLFFIVALLLVDLIMLLSTA